MLPKIKHYRNILVPLRYNEQKVAQGLAVKIGAENFLRDYDRLSKADIIERFRQRSSFNERLHDHGVHFSLNFGKTELLDNTKMVQIANRYMSGMGFEDQPYVIYRHHDAGHTHLHIVATNVKADGSGILIERDGLFKAHALSRKLENEFSLLRSAKAKPEEQQRFAVEHAQRVTYGEPGLKRAISDVLNTVVGHYNYTSLDEFNAILKQYNVTANPGSENSRLHQRGGLLYHALDGDGNRIGVPIKASLFHLKPTLKNLEKRFEQNQSLREDSRKRLHTAIEWALSGRAPDWKGFTESLEKEGISVVTLRKEDKERVFFVDHAGKSAFAGDSLGNGYDLGALRNRCTPEEKLTEEQIQVQKLNLGI